MSDNRFECGCERGGDCTKTTMCALQSALEDRDAEIEELRECELDLLKRLDKAEDEIERLRTAIAYAYEPGCDCATCELHRKALEGDDG